MIPLYGFGSQTEDKIKHYQDELMNIREERAYSAYEMDMLDNPFIKKILKK